MIFFALFYAFFCFFLIIQFFFISIRNKRKISKKSNTFDIKNNLHKISVIIPARNEANNILYLLDSLKNQSFDKHFFEIIIIDDNSEDNTISIIQNYQKQSILNIKILKANKNFDYSPKKSALTLGIAHAQGTLIVTTDADCVAKEKWLETIWDFYQQTDAKFISSPVTFETNQSFFSHFQVIDFASLVVSGGISLSLNVPNMANGANIAYPKDIFEKLEGYQNTPKIASGDDEFLLQKIAQKYPSEIYFLKDKEVIITTKPCESWQQFYKQRKRWASKWKYYQDWKTKLLAVFIFLVNMNLPLSVLLFFSNYLSFDYFISILTLKIIPEFIFLWICLLFFDHKKSIFYIFLVQMIYPFYVILFALAGFGKNYEWKGRKLS